MVGRGCHPFDSSLALGTQLAVGRSDLALRRDLAPGHAVVVTVAAAVEAHGGATGGQDR